MKKILILTGMVIFLLISSCTPNTAPETTATIPSTNTPSKTATVSPTVTKTPIPTGTSEPTLTPSSTAIPENLLSEDGPWLMYHHKDGSVYFVNQDGTGKTEFPNHNDEFDIIFPSTSQKFLTSITSVYFKDQGRYTSLVTVYQLPDFSILKTIDLYSYLADHSMNDDDKKNILGGSGWKWSPNGRYLALSAAIDGPSLDLYVYDTFTDQLPRLTSGENQVGHMYWSPDSQWIVHEEVLYFHGWSVKAMWAARPNGSEVLWLYEPENFTSQQLIGWLDSYRFVTVDSSAEGIQSARLTNLYSNESIVLYSGYFARSGPVFSPDLEIIAFNTQVDGTLPIEDNGLYMMNLNAPALHLVSHNDEITFYDESIGYFMTYSPCQDEENGGSGQLGFKSDGILTCIESTPYYQDSIPPDSKWTLDFEYEKVRLLDSNSNEILIERGTDYEAYWRSDSAGFFLLSKNELYYVPIDSPELTLIDNQLGFSDSKYDSASPEWIGD